MSDAKIEEIAISFTEGKREDIMWCRDDGIDANGFRHFFVYNGSWPGSITPEGTFRNNPVEIIWEGNAPFAVSDYNAAIAWILEQI